MASGSWPCPGCGRSLPAEATECPHCSALTADFRTPFPAIPGYQLVRGLGEGGMGAVYLAEDTTLGRRVAVKVASGKYAAEKESRARFLREARAMATVEHPHIVRVYSFGEADDQPYLIMEYVEGEDVARRLQREGRLPVEDALRIIRQVVEALEAAWEKGIVHRDIKPSNILIDRRGQARVADFGLAKPVRIEGDSTLTQEGSTLGTPQYISPEQARGQPADFRSDVYSLGIVLYEMLTGDRPFDGTTPYIIIEKHVHQTLPPLRLKCPTTPEPVQQLLDWMTQKDPEKRPRSYGEILETVDTLLGISPGKIVTPPILQRPSRLGTKTKVAAVAGALLLVTAAWFVWQMLARKAQPATTQKAGSRLVVAVAPFYGPDEDSTKEGRVMAALVEREITQRLGKYDVKVLGVEETRQPVRSHEAARELGERLGARVVVWGEAFTLCGETEIQPYFTMVPPKKPPAEMKEETEGQRVPLAQDPLAAVEQRAAKAMVVGAAAPNQIELRKTSAAGVGDMVLFLAGIHALYVESNANKALDFFKAAPRTAESLRYEAEALLKLDRKPEALAAVEEAVKLEPGHAQAQAMLGDLLVEKNDWRRAAEVYRAATAAPNPPMTRNGAFYEGKLYVKELVERGGADSAPALLGIDSETGRIVERHRLPELADTFSIAKDGIHISYDSMFGKKGAIVFSKGKFDRPVFLTSNLLSRRMSITAGTRLLVNFVEGRSFGDFSRKEFPAKVEKPLPKYPANVLELEAAARSAIERDPLQPWHLFALGEALWGQGLKVEAGKTWNTVVTGEFPGTAYYEFLWMAYYFERFGQPDWADRAYEAAWARRKQFPNPPEAGWIIERLLNAPIGTFVAQAVAEKRMDPERGWLWVARLRQVMGLATEGEALVAAAWEKYFRENGQPNRAEQEAAQLNLARDFPGNGETLSAKCDYALYVTLASIVGLAALLFFLRRQAMQAGAASESSGLPRGLLWRILAGLAGLAVLTVASWFYTPAKWAPLGLSLGVVAFVALAVVAVRWAIAARTEISTAVRARLVAAWTGIPSIPPAARRTLGISLGATLFSASVLGYFTAQLLSVMAMPVNLSDALAHDHNVVHIEQRLERIDTPELRYVAAVINHMAGNTARARQLYRSVGQDPRAQKNLAALEKGDIVPPELLTTREYVRAYMAVPWKLWPECIAKPFQVLDYAGGDQASRTQMVYVAVFVLLMRYIGPVTTLLSFIYVILFWKIPHRAEQAASQRVPRKRRLGGQLVYSLIPGTFDIRQGSVWMGYISCLLFAFCVFAVVGQAVFSDQAPRLGVFTWLEGPNLYRAFPLPPAPSGRGSEAVAAHYYWAFLTAFPYVKVFLAILAVGVVVSLSYHAMRLRRIWQTD